MRTTDRAGEAPGLVQLRAFSDKDLEAELARRDDERTAARCEALIAAREAAGLGVNEAARRARMNGAYLSQIEKGQRNPSRDKLLKLARVYKVSVRLLDGSTLRQAAAAAEDGEAA